MIALDTNVLVRFLVEGDVAQFRRARAVVEEALARREPLFISDIVLCETLWVLAGRYKFPRGHLIATLEQLLHASNLHFQSHDAAVRALDALRDGKGDFSDYLVREQAIAAGCSSVRTFDRVLLKEPQFDAP